MLTALLQQLSRAAYRFTQRYQPEHPPEYLLPQLRRTIRPAEFPFIAERRLNPAWSAADLEAQLRALGPWEYYFEFGHGLTTELAATFTAETTLFHRYRSELISGTVAALLGDALGRSTVLDLACHCGAFTLDLAQRGAQSVVGIEVREQNLRQARFLREYYRIENAAFEQGDVDQLSAARPVDVVLCLGLLYHVVRPVDLIEFCCRSARQFAVVETLCHPEPISAYRVVTGRNTAVAIEGTRSIELLPTYRAVIDTMRAAGFAEIVEVVGECAQPVHLYSEGKRRCFIGFKPGVAEAWRTRWTAPG